MAKKGPVRAEKDAVDTSDGGVIAEGVDGVDGKGILEDPIPTVFVSKANLGEMKGALDEAVKKHMERLSFKASRFHPTVHLTLGYTSVILSLGSVLYSLRVTFEESKPALWIGVVGYCIFQSLLWAWKRWVEQGEIFRGRRRRIVKRIETDHIQIITSTNLKSPPMPAITFSPHTRPSSPNSAPSSPSSISPATLSPSVSSATLSRHAETPASTSRANATPVTDSKKRSNSISKLSNDSTDRGPTYLVHVNLSTTSNNGKSLLRKSRVVAGKGIGEFIDENGGVEEGEVGRWISGLLMDAGLVAAEETEGMKEE